MRTVQVESQVADVEERIVVDGHAGRRGTSLRAEQALAGRVSGLPRLLPFLGPAFVASVAYVDPGNFATNIQGGARYGYMLIWVVIASNLIAMLVQSLSAKLGIATGRNLPELIRERFPRPVVWVLWVLAELVAMATDLAEFLGAALGFNLLFGLPLLPAALLTAVVSFAILALQRFGFRPLELVISGFVLVIVGAYLIELLLAAPVWTRVGAALVQPRLAGPDSVMLAAGILGATVMPHVIYLHSSLTQHRIMPDSPEQARRIFRFEVVDVVIAMGLAGFVNAAMLLMAATTFFHTGNSHVASVEEAYRTLTPLLGAAASVVFAISLLASGLSSSAVGTLSGQVIMQGFLKRRIPLWLRRLVTMLPALVVIALGLDPTSTLVLSQVVLSLGIPFALIPLVMFTSSRQVMGHALVNGKVVNVAAVVVTVLIVSLNLFLLYQTFVG